MADTPNKEDELLNVELTYEQFCELLVSSWLEAEEGTKVYPSRKFRRDMFTRLENKVKHKGTSQIDNPLKEDLKVVDKENESIVGESPDYEELDILFNKTINAKQIAVTTAASSEDLFSSEEVVEASNKLLDRYRVEFKSAIKSRDQRIALEARKKGIEQVESVLDKYYDWNLMAVEINNDIDSLKQSRESATLYGMKVLSDNKVPENAVRFDYPYGESEGFIFKQSQKEE